MQKFVLLTSQRTGSTYIRLWLNNHHQIRSYGEIVLPHYRQVDGLRHHCHSQYSLGPFFHNLYSNKMLRKLGLSRIPTRYVYEFLNRLEKDTDFPSPWVSYKEDEEKAGKDNATFVGFKLMYSQLESTPQLLDYFADNKYYVLHLVRSNYLKQYVSMCRSKKSTVYHKTTKQNKHSSVMIDTAEMLSFFESISLQTDKYRKLFSAGGRYYEFTYEDFFSNKQQTGLKVLETLGADQVLVEDAKLVKISSNNIDDEILNASDVREALADTAYEHFLSAYDSF